MLIDPDTLPFRVLIDAAPDGILVTGQHGSILLVNAEAERMFGYPHGELVGKAIHQLVPDRLRARHPDHVAMFHAQPRLRPMGSGLDLTGRRSDGTEFPVEISLSPIQHASQQLVVAVVRDVTDRRAIEREAKRASAAKSEFLASMSHELRTPLNAVLGFAQLLDRDRKQPLTDRQRERLQHVLRGGEHLLRLIDDVLDLSQIEAGRVAITTEAVDVRAVLAEVMATLEPMAARAQIELEIAPLPGDLPPVAADRTRLAQILMNFGSNAIKYGKPHGRATFAASSDDARVRVTVIDDGIGIPADKHDRLFEPFQRAGQETGPIEGTGIGLAISKRLAGLMQGEVGFSSDTRTGSRFWVEVPVVAHATTAAELNAPERPALASPLATSAAHYKIVYVEDNPSNIAFMRGVVEDLASVELLTAPTAEIGLPLIRAHLPTIVIMDINLPGMSGTAAVAQLKQWPETRHIPIVGLSAAALPGDGSRATAAGFHRYLTKPVRVAELMATLEALLAPAR